VAHTFAKTVPSTLDGAGGLDFTSFQRFDLEVQPVAKPAKVPAFGTNGLSLGTLAKNRDTAPASDLTISPDPAKKAREAPLER
jgi:hypothetical protein